MTSILAQKLDVGTADIFVSGHALRNPNRITIDYTGRPASPTEHAISRAQSMLKLQENWDDAGAPPIAQEVFARATEFLKSLHSWVTGAMGFNMPVPFIRPVPDGGINLYWKNPKYELLIHFPTNAQSAPDYYGIVENNPHEGYLDLEDREAYSMLTFFKHAAE